MTDFTYRNDGMFITIMPETPEAEEQYNSEIAGKTDGTGKVLAILFPSVKALMEAAGYTVRKADDVEQSDDDLLDELFGL